MNVAGDASISNLGFTPSESSCGENAGDFDGDFDSDNDAGLFDFGSFQLAFTGS
jgi:hypothetical protein